MGRHSRRIGGGIETRRFSLDYGNIFFRSDVETNAQLIIAGSQDVDVFIDGDTDLRVAADVTRASIQGAPDVASGWFFILITQKA